MYLSNINKSRLSTGADRLNTQGPGDELANMILVRRNGL